MTYLISSLHIDLGNRSGLTILIIPQYDTSSRMKMIDSHTHDVYLQSNTRKIEIASEVRRECIN